MSAEPTPSPSSSKCDIDSVDIKEAVNHLIQGKRHMLVQDYASAVSSLQTATELFASKYGEMANECGDAYFSYGKALLELARMETGVLGNALDGVPEEEEENESEESESSSDQVENTNKLSEDEEGSEEKDDDDDENDEEKEEEIDHSPEPKDKENNDAEEGGKPEEDEDDDKEEEVTNLQLSWEVIELAKIIFERQCDSNNNTMKLKTADAYLKLGEIAIESGNYSQAIDDLNRCHKIRTEILQPDDRLIAETFYQLGLAFSFNSEFDKGKEKFEEALKVIKERLLNLENSLESVKDDYEQFDKCAREIDDLKGLIPEINNKIDDTEDMKKNAIKAQADAIKEALAKEKVLGGECSTSQGGFPSGFTSGSTADGKSQIGFTSGSPTKPVTNIGHLIRKKRKPEESDQTMEIKKSRTSEDNKTNINLNGNMENSSENKSTQDSCQDVAAS